MYLYTYYVSVQIYTTYTEEIPVSLVSIMMLVDQSHVKLTMSIIPLLCLILVACVSAQSPDNVDDETNDLVKRHRIQVSGHYQSRNGWRVGGHFHHGWGAHRGTGGKIKIFQHKTQALWGLTSLNCKLHSGISISKSWGKKRASTVCMSRCAYACRNSTNSHAHRYINSANEAYQSSVQLVSSNCKSLQLSMSIIPLLCLVFVACVSAQNPNNLNDETKDLVKRGRCGIFFSKSFGKRKSTVCMSRCAYACRNSTVKCMKNCLVNMC
ncbi:unnamed protein product [Mytilus coruscus]|uniref:Uncharacterized protein n=1 Tax=Mytilus coruscus TaxID=42192 RepID=A0A6J8AIG8_MYTCO|nr:unnamed protein product [Mytilus coruscus]